MVTGGSRRVRAARKRRRRVAAAANDLTTPQWEALRAAWGGCAYCGASDRPLQRDCLLPISRGGRYTLTNVAPACGPCNASKGNAEVILWLRQRRRDERTFLSRHVEIQAALAGAGGAGDRVGDRLRASPRTGPGRSPPAGPPRPAPP